MKAARRTGPAFVALRAAALGVDDLSRAALRTWASEGTDHRGEPIAGFPAPTEPATVAIVAAWATMSDDERLAYRAWLLRWFDYSGRIITPNERARRLADIAQGYRR